MNLELLKSLVILYVEDEKDLQNEVYKNLLPFVKDIFLASDGYDGLELYKSKQDNIDIVISDILMPRIDGIAMMDEIRKISLNVPIIYTTAFNDNNYLLKTIEQSVSGFILKPIDIELLLNAVEKASVRVENTRLKLSLIKSNEELELKVQEKTQELKEQHDTLYYQLHTDRLTNLLNRKSLLRDLETLDKPVLILIDIDAFKNINDIYGEHIGNLVLHKLSLLLKIYVEDKDYNVYRVGADEFVLMKDRTFSKQNCIDRIQEIIALVNNKEIFIDDYDISIRINITIGVSTTEANTLETADMALKRAKKDKLSYLIYEEDKNIDKEYEDDIKWTKIIEEAIVNKKLIPYYQPIVDVDESITKYEALMRIVDGDEVYSPVLFLDIAKKVKLYSKLEKIMIDQVIEQVKIDKRYVNINISIEDIVNREFVKFIDTKLNGSDIAKYITFEILESESIIDYDEVVTFIEMIKSFGCTVAIDDFGSGYSNFAHLLKLNPEYIKIDGSLIKNIDTDKNSLIIVRTINNFAHDLGIKTVAEYVHSSEVFDVLKSIGIDEFQGFYFGKPQL